jgi:hypothetical protein
MHGTEHRIQERRALGLSAPHVAFLPPPGSTLPGPPQLSPQWDRSLVTAFRSPATAPAFTGSIPGSMFPACYFASCSVASRPVRLSAPPLVPVRPGPGSFFASARRLFASSPDRLCHRPPLPSGTFASRWIKAFCRFSADQPAFRSCPISSRSPLPRLLLVAESDQRSRSATFPEARCSSNLLEPFSLCTPLYFPSTEFVSGRTLFLKFLTM